jgi:hypothetical protein
VPSVGHRRQINSGDIEVLRGALGICSHLGETEFLDISGDFDVVIATPPGGLEPLVVNLKNGKVLVPSSQRAADPPFEWPIFAFAEHASTNLSAQGYLASVRHAIVIEKEAAILAFRSAAERRILDFDRALAGRVPEGHWLEGAKELVARLKAGLGDTLAGLSEDARGKALDWSTGIENAGNVRPVGVPRIVIGADKPKALRVAG